MELCNQYRESNTVVIFCAVILFSNPFLGMFHSFSWIHENMNLHEYEQSNGKCEKNLKLTLLVQA